MDSNAASPEFLSGANVISIVSHPPEIQPGTPVKIVKPWFGSLCVVQLPDGMIHRWFAWFELNPVSRSFSPGSQAEVINSAGHGYPPHVEVGTMVRIVKCMPRTIFYDVMVHGEYHRWLAQFELARPI